MKGRPFQSFVSWHFSTRCVRAVSSCGLVEKQVSKVIREDLKRADWRKWYDHRVWRKRRKVQLRQQPFCQLCAAHGEVTVATVVDHVMPHEGDWNRFRLDPVQSLCKPCHDGTKRFEQNRGFDPTIGADGMPTDPRHPVYQGFRFG